MTPDTKNKIKLAALMLVTILPITFATMSFRAAMNDGSFGGTTNKGQLITPPMDITALELRTTEGDPAFKTFDDIIAELDDDDEYEIQPWMMVYVTAKSCDQACLDRIYELRQLHVALGKDIQRVRRYFVNASGTDLSPELSEMFREDYPSMGIAVSDYQRIRRNFGDANIDLQLPDESYVIFIDPVGNVMMYYTEDKTAQDIMSDLETLLRHSSLG
ncbi:MAG: hypothetical protein R3332_08775 [Pseudohongiellaceae bacterium]|nr:hypothetical protein [Pseudohongiellaceae bacterium]